jgi:hypothetical protein
MVSKATHQLTPGVHSVLITPFFFFYAVKTGFSSLRTSVSLEMYQAALLFMSKKVKDFKLYPPAS